ncbi:hypothetical protein N7468_007863 [Penicillium chermesinum]|uniref:Uncharacterized protein n=1 Tax=Penicillium chermesinum TaxID=63820 RepID=A0A9W9NNP1_9EURO|nr:uncharacterized protein N7468_007863 [Penicillium chermesinum]KAJ5223321.1 hypothetical protein N7468_007863 [Penicillium chermesinum]KAJ6155839.1 hypothetical protein N7470_006405 [Penicillium chermesinum]
MKYLFSYSAVTALLEASLVLQAAAVAIPLKLEARGFQFENVFAFGDSYTTNGFNDHGPQPKAENVIGNPNFPGETTTGGINWPEFLVTAVRNSPALLYDLAVSGATVDNTFVAASTGVSTFVQQAASFVSTYGPNTAGAGVWTSDNSLFTVWFGINDINAGYKNSNYETLVHTVIKNYFDQVTNLYNSGARHFVFLGVPPIQRTPQFISQGSAAQDAVTNAIAYYNQLVQDGANDFKNAHADAAVSYLDTIPVFDQALNNPTAYGSPDAVCYNSDGTSCLWWNNFHPGQAIDKLVAEAVADLIKG